MEHILSILYGASGVSAAALYIPQIRKYRRERGACMSISLLSWSGWVAITAITVLYALFVAKNYLFATVAAINVAAQMAVLGYGVQARFAPLLPARRSWRPAEIFSPASLPAPTADETTRH